MARRASRSPPTLRHPPPPPPSNHPPDAAPIFFHDKLQYWRSRASTGHSAPPPPKEALQAKDGSFVQFNGIQNRYNPHQHVPPPPPPKGLPPQGRSCLVRAANYEVNTQMTSHRLRSFPILKAIQMDAVPEFLRDGHLYRTFIADCYVGEDEVLLPAQCVKVDDVFESTDDVVSMLLTLRFWLTAQLPEKLIAYSINNCKINPLILVHLRSFLDDLPQLQPLLQVLDCYSFEGRMEQAVELGHLPIMRCLHEWKQSQQPVENEIVLPLVNRLGLPVHPIMRVFQRAAPDLCAVAAERGHLHCLQYLREVCEYEWAESTCRAALSGNHECCLRYALQHDCPVPITDDGNFCTTIVQKGYLDCLALAHKRGCSITSETCVAAANDVKCLMYLREQGCPWSNACAAAAARAGNLESIEFIYCSGGGWDATCSAGAAASGQLIVLQFVHTRGCTWDHTCTNAAAENDSLSCLKYAVQQGCNLDAAILVRAVRKGSINCLRYLRSLGLPWTEAFAKAAADENNPIHHANSFACLKYAIECGCPHDQKAFFVYQRRCNAGVTH